MASKSQEVQTNEVVTCEICGKHLTREQSLEAGMGHRCETLREQGWTGEKLQKHYAKLRTDEVPEGYVKVADLHRKINSKKATIPGLTVSKMVRAIGKDRAIEGPAHPIAKPVYDQRNHRWVDGWLMTDEGLKAIATNDWSKAPDRK